MKECWCGNIHLSEYSDEYFKCEQCNTLVSKVDVSNEVCNVVDEENDLYGKYYWQEQMIQLSGKKSLDEIIDFYLEERAIYWLKHFFKYCLPNSGDIAEIGCGLGQFSYLLKESGYNQVAFELSPDICDFIKKRLGISIHCGEFCRQENAYDSIVAFDLIEHVVNPHILMDNIEKSLKANGILMLQTPCYDYALSYQDMLIKKTAFNNQLKSREHVYLYSKESISALLKKFGFNYCKFEPAYFGDDYDMFVFASRNPIKKFSNRQICEALNRVPNGRMIKAIINIWDHREKIKKIRTSIENESIKRLEQIDTLTQMLDESESDREERLKLIDKLSIKLQEVELDSAARLEQINTLTHMLQVSENDRAERLKVIESLKAQLQEKQQRKL